MNVPEFSSNCDDAEEGIGNLEQYPMSIIPYIWLMVWRIILTTLVIFGVMDKINGFFEDILSNGQNYRNLFSIS